MELLTVVAWRHALGHLRQPHTLLGAAFPGTPIAPRRSSMRKRQGAGHMLRNPFRARRLAVSAALAFGMMALAPEPAVTQDLPGMVDQILRGNTNDRDDRREERRWQDERERQRWEADREARERERHRTEERRHQMEERRDRMEEWRHREDMRRREDEQERRRR